MSEQEEMTIAEKAAFAVDALVGAVTELRVQEQAGSANDEYEALAYFYNTRNDLYSLIPGCGELIVDPTEELKDFVEHNADDLFYEWEQLGLTPDELWLTDEMAEGYQEYLDDGGDDE